jgi:ATP-dependent DNA ligase
MVDVKIMKAVEFDKLPAKFRKGVPGGVQELQKRGWWVQPKYDGCFGMAVIRADACPGSCQMLSRTGEDYTFSCEHILKEIYDAADEFFGGAKWSDFVVLGEVWHPDLKFPTISGMFRKHAPSKLQFITNDMLPTDLNTEEPYSSRFQHLQNLLPPVLGDGFYVRTARSFEAHYCQQDVNKYAAQLVAEGGYDGAILRDPNAGYTIGLVKKAEIVKVKPTMSLDLRCVDARTEPGAKTGRAVLTISVEYRGVVSDVGSGVPHDMLVGDVCGKVVEVECIGITEDGKLREPRFKGIRFDKTEPDA